MNAIEIINIIREFEVREGEDFFSLIDNIVDNVDFLKWLKINYPRIYNLVEKLFQEKYPDKIFEEEIPKWNVDMMEYIFSEMCEYYAQVNGGDYCHASGATYYVIAEYMLEKEPEDVVLSKLKTAIDNYYN